MCVAGWAVALTCPPFLTVKDYLTQEKMKEQVLGMKVLFPELSISDPGVEWENYSNFLFLPWNHADVRGRQLETDHTTTEQLREEALRRIDWLLADKDISLYEMPLDVPAKGETCNNPDCDNPDCTDEEDDDNLPEDVRIGHDDL
jgi:hypothetical protein